MPVEKVLARDGAYGVVLGRAGIGIVGAISQLHGLALRDVIDIVIAARDGAEELLAGKLDLVRTKLRVLQHVEDDRKNLIKVFFERAPAQEGGIVGSGGFH